MPTTPLRICFTAAEIAPLAKTGGLADVAAALPRSLHRLGHDVRLFMPYYSSVALSEAQRTPVPEVQNVTVQLGLHRLQFSLLASRLSGADPTIYLVDCPAMYARGAVYTQAADEHLRFLLFQRAVLESCQRLRFAPQIMHCNDWHVALLPLMLKSSYAWDQLFASTRSLLSIHNIGYQGVFAATTLDDVGIPDVLRRLHPTDLASGHVNWLKEGIVHADAISTVSPTYAQEISMPGGGYGLDPMLRDRVMRGDAVVGILNGVDYETWNPALDAYLPFHFSPLNLSGKPRCKAELCKRLPLHVPPQTPLIGIVSRLAVQKGIDLLFDSLPGMLATREVAFAILGSGEARYESFFTDLQRRFPGRVSFTRAYDEALAHLIEAGADMFLMPSLYEPCGLNQMYSLKYGTVPIVRRTGGLADSVQTWNPATGTGTGIVFNDYDVPAIRWALNTALDFFKDQTGWRKLMLNGMAKDYSWDHQAEQYVELYERML